MAETAVVPMVFFHPRSFHSTLETSLAICEYNSNPLPTSWTQWISDVD